MSRSSAPDNRLPAFQLLGSFVIAGAAGWLFSGALLLINREGFRLGRGIDFGIGEILIIGTVPTLVQIAIGIGLFRQSRWVAIPFADLTAPAASSTASCF